MTPAAIARNYCPPLIAARLAKIQPYAALLVDDNKAPTVTQLRLLALICFVVKQNWTDMEKLGILEYVGKYLPTSEFSKPDYPPFFAIIDHAYVTCQNSNIYDVTRGVEVSSPLEVVETRTIYLDNLVKLYEKLWLADTGSGSK